MQKVCLNSQQGISLLLQQPSMQCAQSTEVKLIQRPDPPPAGASILTVSHASSAAGAVGEEVGGAQGEDAFATAARAIEGVAGVATCQPA